jgi:hypothetical protein
MLHVWQADTAESDCVMVNRMFGKIIMAFWSSVSFKVIEINNKPPSEEIT